MEREQFDKLMKLIDKSTDSTWIKREVLISFLKEMFPQFTQPKFRRCRLLADDPPITSAFVVDTTQFQIVEDEERVYWVSEKEHSSIMIFNKKGGYWYPITKESILGQQILSFLKEVS